MNFGDNWIGSLGAGYTSGAGTLVIASATVGSNTLPSGSSLDFYVTVEAETSNTRETFHVTARTGTTLTVTGAQGNTSASNHANGAVVNAYVMTSNMFSQFAVGGGSGGIQLGPRANLPAVIPAAGSEYICSNGPYTFVSDGAAWNAFVGGVPVTEPLLANFPTQINFANFSADDTRGGIYVQDTLAFGTGASQQVGLLLQATPAAPYTMTVGFWLTTLISNGFNGGGGFLRASGSGKLIGADKIGNNSNFDYRIQADKWTDATTFSAPYTAPSIAPSNPGTPMTYLRIKDTGTQRIFYYGTDPFNFQQYTTPTANTDFITANQLGLGVINWDGTYNVGIWFLHFKVSTP